MALNVQKQVPLSPLTTFQIGGNAESFVEIKNTDELKEALEWAREHKIAVAILAGGSNVLVADDGFDGLVIHIVSDGHVFDGQVLTADAGCNLLSLIHEAGSRGLGGWESLAGIPGTIGGAARGNAGAFGTEIKDVLTSVEALHRETFEVRKFTNAECAFAYRQSFFKSHPEWIITSVSVALQVVDATTSAVKSEETITERERRHLQNVKAAGSYFMNPTAPTEVIAQFEQEKNVKAREGRVPAGWLIEKAGMKGAVVGGAMASMQHPNYLVNTGNATSADVRELAQMVKDAVKSQFGVDLKEEAVQF